MAPVRSHTCCSSLIQKGGLDYMDSYRSLPSSRRGYRGREHYGAHAPIHARKPQRAASPSSKAGKKAGIAQFIQFIQGVGRGFEGFPKLICGFYRGIGVK